MEPRSPFSRTTGLLYLISAVLGIVISLGGLIGLWATKASTTERVTSAVSLAGKTMDATGVTIEVIGRALNRAADNMELITSMTAGVASTLNDSQSLIDSTANLVGTDLVGFVEETQESLLEVEDSARMVDSALATIDNTLQLISRIPLIGSGLPQASPTYQPRTPLEESVAEVSRSLDPLPASFGQIQSQLETSAAHAATIQSEIERLSEELDDIQTNIDEARTVADEYRDIIDTAQARFDNFERRLPLLLNTIYLGISLLLVWMLISQIAVLAHGLEIFRG